MSTKKPFDLKRWVTNKSEIEQGIKLGKEWLKTPEGKAWKEKQIKLDK